MTKLSIFAGAALALSALAVPRVSAAQDLVPPPPIDPATGQPAQPRAAEAPTPEEKDSGIGLEWVYANAELGASTVNMKSFSESQLAVVDSSKSGGLVGFGAGVRLLFLSLGLRARNHTAMNLWQINGEVGFHMKFGRIDPYLVFRGGYDTVGSFSQSVSSAAGSSQVDVHGWNVGAGFGLDVYLAKIFSIGGEISGDILFLTRPPAPLPASVNALPQAQKDQITNDPLYKQSGSSVGFGGTLSAHLALHF